MSRRCPVSGCAWRPGTTTDGAKDLPTHMRAVHHSDQTTLNQHGGSA